MIVLVAAPDAANTLRSAGVAPPTVAVWLAARRSGAPFNAVVTPSGSTLNQQPLTLPVPTSTPTLDGGAMNDTPRSTPPPVRLIAILAAGRLPASMMILSTALLASGSVFAAAPGWV